MHIENIKKEIKKYNGKLEDSGEFIIIYGTIPENDVPESIIGYDFDDLVCEYKDGYFGWELEINKDKLIYKENKIKKKDIEHTREKQRKKFEVKKREKRERQLQQNLNEFIKEYNNS